MAWEIPLLLASILMLVFALYSRRQAASKTLELQNAVERESAERQRLEQALRSSQERFEQILDNIPLALYIREPVRGTSATYMSRAYETLWKQPRQQLYENPRAWLDPIHPDDLPDVLRAVEKSYETHIPMNLEFRLVHKDGSTTWVHLQNFHINPNAEGRPERVVGVIEDITERKSAEQDRITLVIEQERNHFLRQLLTTISHDFRTPMTTINTNVYLLRRALDSQPNQQRLTMIEQQVKRLDELLGDALAMMKLDGNLQLERSPADLNQVLRELEPDIRAITQSKNHSLTINLAPTMLPVSIHLDRFRQALTHLIENAAQFTESGQPITIMTAYREGFAIVDVCDTGIGIAAEDLPHLFEPFYRGDKARGTLTGGAGVGLTIARRIIDLHQGQIQVESIVGQGSTFRVLLPVINENSTPHPY